MLEEKENSLVKIENITKIYNGVVALSDVSFDIKKSEVRALMGENGAGKSTLIRQIMGVEKPNFGCVKINCNNEWITPNSVIEASKNGLAANYQHVNIANELCVAENYFLGNMPTNKFGIIDWKKAVVDSKAILEKFNLDINPLTKVKDLSIANQAMITISKISLNKNLRLVIFDEPTALLENEKVATLFNFIKELKQKGISIIYVSHRIEEILEICDSITVLKDGTYVDTKPIKDVTKHSIISLMVGREVSNIYNIKHFESKEELLRVQNLSNAKHYKNVNFNVHRGEIVGFFGLVGAGRSEVMKGIFGVDHTCTGQIFLNNKEVKIKTPKSAMNHGIGLIPEDRLKEGLAMSLSVSTNINIGSYETISKYGVISLKKEKDIAEKYKKEIYIKVNNINQKVSDLSGGNQQKVVVGKLLAEDPDLFIFDEPTVGIDVGAKQEIYKIIENLVAAGKGIIVISSYLPEVIGLSDRMYVMAEGEIVAAISGNEMKKMSEDDYLKLASKII